MNILIGTLNEYKIEGAKKAFARYFDNFTIEGIKVSSLVNEQPLDNDILTGARNRVNNLIEYAKDNNMEIDYYLGIESGITKMFDNWFITNVAVIKDKNGYESIGMGPSFKVPSKYVDEVINNDLNYVFENLYKDDLLNYKGGIGLLTQNALNRVMIVENAFIMALIEHINYKWNDK